MSYVAFAPGAEVEGVFTFCTGHDQPKVSLEIHKKETEELTYKLGITYLGLDKRERDSWKIEINDESPKHSRGGMTYHSSQKFEFQPYGRYGIEVNESNGKATEKAWIDLTGDRYTVSRSPLKNYKRIQTLLVKAKIFTPSDGKHVKNVFYNQSVGVLIFTHGGCWNRDVYFAANEDEDFTKCDAKTVCRQEDSQCEIRLPGKTDAHMFISTQSLSGQDNFSWDGIPLNKLEL